MTISVQRALAVCFLGLLALLPTPELDAARAAHLRA